MVRLGFGRQKLFHVLLRRIRVVFISLINILFDFPELPLGSLLLLSPLPSLALGSCVLRQFQFLLLLLPSPSSAVAGPDLPWRVEVDLSLMATDVWRSGEWSLGHGLGLDHVLGMISDSLSRFSLSNLDHLP